MKKILMIATYFPPMAGVGTVRITKYVKYLKKYNWIPTVLTVSEKFITNYDDTLLKDIDEKIKVIKLDFPHKNKEKLGKNFYKGLKEKIDFIIKKEKYDAVFITGGPFEPMKIAPYIYKKFKIPYIIDLRDPWKLQKINKNTKINEIKSRVKKIIDGFYEKRIFSNASAICTVNNTMTEQYQKEYPRIKEKFFTIPNGYDPIDYDNIKPKTIRDFSILYSGKFEVSAGFRNPNTIFRAIRLLNEKGYNVKFIHIGIEEKKVIEMAKEEGIEEYCIFKGRKTYHETLQYCKGADILLAIGGNEKSEQTGKIFDYIGCKKPILVLANENSEINVVCKDVENAYCIRKEEVNKMIEIISKIYDKPEKTNNQNIVLEQYTREKLTNKLVQILEKSYEGKKDDKKSRNKK